MKQRRFSVVDIGTNSARFLAVEASSDGVGRAVADRREPCRLGEGLSADGMLGEAPMARAITAIEVFKLAAEEAKAPIVRAVATHAVRRAGNRDEFLRRVRERTGVELEAIPPRIEGRLSYRAVTDEVKAGNEPKLQRIGVLDTGGGSVQLTVGVGDVPVASVSMPLGAVALTESFGGTESSAGDRFDELREHIIAVVEEMLAKLPFLPRRLYGVGGGCTSMGMLARLMARGMLVPGGAGLVKGIGGSLEVVAAEARELTRTVRAMSLAERAALPGLSAERAQIIIPGLAVIDAVLSRVRPHRMTTMHPGLREGLAIEAMDWLRARAAARGKGSRVMLRFAAERLAQRCRAEQPHTEHVTALAMMLHGQLVKLAEAGEIKKGRWCRQRAAAILHAAGSLHDGGVSVAYKGHHKHIEAIVRLNGLAGVGPGDADLVAAVARYHRRAQPSRKHELYGGMDKRDRRLVRMLAGILRIADGCDRSHAQVTGELRTLIEGEGLRIVLHAQHEPREELKAAAEKSDLLARVLHRRVSVVWSGRETSLPAARE